MRRLRSYERRIYRRLAAEATLARQHPKRTAGIVAVWAALTWLVLSTSLADAVAVYAPEFALMLNGSHPVALVALAEQQRTKLRASPKIAGTAVAPTTTAAAEPSVQVPSEPDPDTILAIRSSIRSLASRAVASDPLNGRAYGLLGAMADDPAIKRAAMQEALKRSRRESGAALWLMQDSFERQDLTDVVAKADILMRTRAALAPEVMKYLAEVAVSPDGRQALVALFARNPAWRGTFFNALPNAAREFDTPLQLMLALKENRNPPEAKELGTYLRFLVAKNLAGYAYDAWLQFLPPEKVEALGLINNINFSGAIGETPFDWQIARGLNAVVELVPAGSDDGARALRFSFGSGRVKFPQVSQIVVLAPGRYRFEGVVQGAIAAKRGLRWQLQCDGPKSPKFETEMLHGNSRAPQSFTLDFEVPNRADCRAQTLRLIHDARSASEELVSGVIQFQELSLARLEQ